MKGEEAPMCPACMASAALMAGSVMSTGGIAALAVRMVRGKGKQQDNSKTRDERRNDDGNLDNQQNDDEQNRTGDGGAAS
jgi:hypothetical protein